jgi:hypothetical protein
LPIKECDNTPVRTYTTPVADNVIAGSAGVEVSHTGPQQCRHYQMHEIVVQPWGVFDCHDYEAIVETKHTWKYYAGVTLGVLGAITLGVVTGGVAFGVEGFLAVGGGLSAGATVATGVGTAGVASGTAIATKTDDVTTTSKGAKIRDYQEDQKINGTTSSKTKVYTDNWHNCTDAEAYGD